MTRGLRLTISLSIFDSKSGASIGHQTIGEDLQEATTNEVQSKKAEKRNSTLEALCRSSMAGEFAVKGMVILSPGIKS